MGIPPKPILPKGGVNVQATPILLEEGWAVSQLIRFKDSLLQKIGGCLRMISTPFVGICRGLFAWSDLGGNDYVAIGTNQRLEIITAGALSDITPITATSNLAAPFSTTAGSPIVTVDDPAADVNIGDWIDIETAAYVDGLFLQGFYQVTTVVSHGYQFNAGSNALTGVSNQGVTTEFTTTNGSHVVAITLGAFVFTNNQTLTIFDSTTVGGITIRGPYEVTASGPNYSIQTIGVPTSAASAFENGNQVAIAYLIESAVEMGGGSADFGGGDFGQGDFGTGSAVPPFGGWLRQWSMDNWGEDLLAGITSGSIYTWTPPVSLGNVATVLTNSPAQNTGFFVNAPAQQVIAYGCTDPNTGQQDPMLVRFTDVGDNTDWTASATNQAGSFRLSAGNQIIGGLSVGNQAILWTDLDMWIMQYIGFPLVYGFERAARDCGLYSKRSACISGNIIVWLGFKDFHQYDGTSVSNLRCTVWDFIFNNIDTNYPGAAFAAVDAIFTEMFFFFPTAGSNGVCDAYVKFNYKDGLWDYGPVASLSRSAWYQDGPSETPIGTDYNGLVQIQEAAIDLDGSPMDSYAQTGWMALAEGDEHVLMKWFLPDFIMTGGSVLVTLLFADYSDVTDPDNPVRVYGPYTITSTTPYVYVNGRGRYFAMKIESVGLGVFWRLGRCKAVLQPDGKGI
jgi:hypothetical protein